MNKRKVLLLTAGLAIATSTFAVTSCSTSWIHWKAKNGGDRTSYTFYHNQALPNQYEVRYKDLLGFENAEVWNPTTNVLDLSKLNNHYELFEFFGLLTQLKYKTSIDANWKLDDWPNFVTYLNQIQSKQTINIVDQGQRYGSINVDFSADIAYIIPPITSYIPDPDTTRPKGVDGKYFDKAKKYDVEYDGLNSDSGLPVDFIQIAKVGTPLTQNPSVSALLSIDQQFALSLSKLVNVPIASFDNFAKLLTTMNSVFDTIINNQGFINWLIEKNVDLNITPDGKIPNPEIDNIPNLFKGRMLDTILK